MTFFILHHGIDWNLEINFKGSPDSSNFIFKGSPYPSYFIVGIIFGKSRIRLGTTQHSVEIQNRSMSDPPLSDLDFKNKMAWVWITLKVRKRLDSELTLSGIP